MDIQKTPSTDQIVAAWRNPAKAAKLSADVKAQVPTNPAGEAPDASKLLEFGTMAETDRRTHGSCNRTMWCFSSRCASLLCPTGQHYCDRGNPGRPSGPHRP